MKRCSLVLYFSYNILEINCTWLPSFIFDGLRIYQLLLFSCIQQFWWKIYRFAYALSMLKTVSLLNNCIIFLERKIPHIPWVWCITKRILFDVKCLQNNDHANIKHHKANSFHIPFNALNNKIAVSSCKNNSCTYTLKCVKTNLAHILTVRRTNCSLIRIKQYDTV